MVNRFKKAFTLVEMLIVVVIIGILATALLPQLLWAQEKAEDTARKADMNKLQWVMAAYRFNKWYYPVYCGSITNDANGLIKELQKYWDMTDDIADPNLSWFMDITFAGSNNGSSMDWDGSVAPWRYAYCSLKHKWNSNAWFVIMAKVATEWVANMAIAWEISGDFSVDEFNNNKCSSFIPSDSNISYTGKGGVFAAPDAKWVCTYNEWDLYYVLAVGG